MRKYIPLVIATLALAAWGVLPASAIIPPTDSGDASSLFGEKHNYYIKLRSDGASVVFAKLVFPNHSDAAQKTYEMSLPKGVSADALKDITAIQIIPQKVCERYATQSSGSAARPPASDNTREDASCLEYKSSYNLLADRYYTSSSVPHVKYQKANLSAAGNKLEVTLAQEVPSHDTGALLLYFKTSSFTKSTLGFGSFTFNTMAVNAPVQNATISIDLDEELYTRTNTSKGSYNKTAIESGAMSMKSGVSASDNSRLDSLVTAISNGGGSITKTADSLSANESYKVKFDYTDASWKLYIGWITGGIIVIAAIVVAMAWMYKKVYKGVK